MTCRWLLSVVAASLLSLFAAPGSSAQSPREIHGQVVDATGAPVAGAKILLGGVEQSKTDAEGRFAITVSSTNAPLTAVFGGLHASVPSPTGTDLHLVLIPATIDQSATVTATRSSVEMGIVAATVETLSSTKLYEYPALTLDERLRQHAGFELFRRSSSWVANPTSEGISLRGLGSTAASRTLVLSDLVPLNDGFGGWIHWNEQPPETIDAITLASGGGSDLYGSSALGGVIDIVPSRPGTVLASADIAGASEDTSNYSGRADLRHESTSALVAGQSFRTAGYTIVAPAIRGKVDVPSNGHYQNGRVELARTLPREGRAWLTGNLLNEDHGNGTPIQTNGTRLWRYIAGDDWKAGSHVDGRVRGYGSNEGYRQSFSSINAARSTENITRLQRVRTQEFGVSTDAAYHFEHVALIAGGDLRDLRATDFETPYSAGAPTGIQDTSARQRFYGGFGEIVAEHHGWSGALSLRGDEAANLDTNAIVRSGTKPQTLTRTPDRHEAVLSPRLGISKQLPARFELHASVFRAFRTPTMNELYRTGQVGQQTTLANSALLSERATGIEGGAHWTSPRSLAALQATYFWTEINRPVSTVFQSGTATSTTLLRENLGQIQSQGAALGAQLQPGHGLSLDFGYQYAHAVVTAFQPQQTLVGLWIPQVPRHTATGQLRYHHGPGSFTLAARQSGRAFDDSANTFELHTFFVLDAYAEYRVHSHISAYLSFQNLLNRSIETARTPNLTLGTPFLAQGGVRLNWGRN
ncbi:outer membrane receptor protein involved in Fe transport [Granulicella aggregans]|uniref:Outer membrane receptor protein involved in Fe transport n=1 Tax=Granulicella aggregans TaxID=474949 RepID=A0A7W7ZHW0_9BACT|nr:TonB-dependent receptor [Granulicella aggregans]MBB5059561.1 outer membrane receptor protein involved in Fe transport [Granulicella aggregans]